MVPGILSMTALFHKPSDDVEGILSKSTDNTNLEGRISAGVALRFKAFLMSWNYRLKADKMWYKNIHVYKIFDCIVLEEKDLNKQYFLYKIQKFSLSISSILTGKKVMHFMAHH